MNANRTRILVIEDDPPIRRLLRSSLSTQTYELIESENGAEGMALAASHNPDLILLDLGLPDMDGLDAIKRIREWSPVPIIVISARGQERDKVTALDLGADDYLTKPFGVSELLARIRVSLRRNLQPAADSMEPEVHLGDVMINLEKRNVTRAGKEIHLTPIEFKLMEVLLRHRGKVLTHRQLLQEVWGPSHAGQTHYLRIYVLHLRRKLEEDAARPRWIISEAGVGYRIREEA
ncbi:response regulator [Candidatus Sumerlaeota bacterium]|nr:response regulator [Candidatus Sumerlaeota bacterium]